MDCRETGTLLIAFHDGELPEADRARVEAHIEGCPACRALLAGLARADEAAGVPDPGPEYWERFNDRVMARVDREAAAPKAVVLRPKHGWVRQQLRYLVPAIAAAALVVVVVRYAGMEPGTPAPPVPVTSAPRIHEPPPLPRISPDSRSIPGNREKRASAERVAGKPADHAASPAVNAVPTESVPAVAAPPARALETGRVALAPAPAPPAPVDDRLAAFAREEKADRATGGTRQAAESAAQLSAQAPAAAGAAMPARSTAMVQSSVKADKASEPFFAKDMASAGVATSAPTPAMRSEAKAESAAKSRSAKDRSDSPCELARRLASRGRLKEAEVAQRACLKQSQAPAEQEDGLVFLAELLDRQSRFAEADAVIEEMQRQFPGSRPLDRYMQQRPMVQRQLPLR